MNEGVMKQNKPAYEISDVVSCSDHLSHTASWNIKSSID